MNEISFFEDHKNGLSIAEIFFKENGNSSGLDEPENFYRISTKDQLEIEKPSENFLYPKNDMEKKTIDLNKTSAAGITGNIFGNDNNLEIEPHNFEQLRSFDEYTDKNSLSTIPNEQLSQSSKRSIYYLEIDLNSHHKLQKNPIFLIGKKERKKFMTNKQIKIIELRKFKADCLRKKCKTNHFKSIHTSLEDFSKSKNLQKFKTNLINDITIDFNRKLYSKTILEFLEENKYIFEDKMVNFESLMRNEIFLRLIAHLTIFDFLDEFYYKKNSDYPKCYQTYTEFEEKIKEDEPYEYYINLKYYNTNFSKYFREEKANKKRSDRGILKPRKNKDKI